MVLGITGFCGHVEAREYPVARILDEEVNREAFAGKKDRLLNLQIDMLGSCGKRACIFRL